MSTNQPALIAGQIDQLCIDTIRTLSMEFPPILRATGDIAGYREHLSRLLVQQQVVVAEVAAGHMPVEVLGC